MFFFARALVAVFHSLPVENLRPFGDLHRVECKQTLLPETNLAAIGRVCFNGAFSKKTTVAIAISNSQRNLSYFRK